MMPMMTQDLRVPEMMIVCFLDPDNPSWIVYAISFGAVAMAMGYIIIYLCPTQPNYIMHVLKFHLYTSLCYKIVYSCI